MTPFIVSKSNDLFSIVTSQGILCHAADRQTAFDAVAATGYPAPDEILDRPAAPPEFFRATWAAAVSCELSDLGELVEQLPSSEVTDELSRRLDDTANHLVEIRSELMKDRHAAELRYLESRFADFIEQCVAVHVGRGQSDASVRTIVVRKAWETPLGRELLQSREANANL